MAQKNRQEDFDEIAQGIAYIYKEAYINISNVELILTDGASTMKLAINKMKESEFYERPKNIC